MLNFSPLARYPPFNVGESIILASVADLAFPLWGSYCLGAFLRLSYRGSSNVGRSEWICKVFWRVCYVSGVVERVVSAGNFFFFFQGRIRIPRVVYEPSSSSSCSSIFFLSFPFHLLLPFFSSFSICVCVCLIFPVSFSLSSLVALCRTIRHIRPMLVPGLSSHYDINSLNRTIVSFQEHYRETE